MRNVFSAMGGPASPFGRRGGAAPPAFSPSTLYSSGSQGIWLDPSDLSTMFSDRAGTTPVTTPGTVVGLRLDKSKGLVLGSELVVNGAFASGTTTGWTPSSVTLSVVDGRLRVVALDNDTRFTWQSFATVVGRTYDFSFAYDSGTMSQIFYSVGTGAGAANNIAYTQKTGAATIRMFFVATATTTFINFGAWTGNSGKEAFFDNISVRELAGNHAVAPTDAARPIYGVEPKGGRRNLLLATDTLATQSLTVTAVAHTLAFTGTGTVTLSGASTAGPLVGTGAGNRVTLTFTPTAASLTLTVSGSVTLGQLELGSSATAYQKVVTAYDVTESGVQTCHYVQYDGSDDSMSTAAIDFTATDKMSVFAGVRKLSDASRQMLVEHSATSDSNAGSFGLLSPETNYVNDSNYGLQLRGTTFVYGELGTFVAPINNVVAISFDIAATTVVTEIAGRVNGSSVTLGDRGGSAGTGNFGSYSLFFGRRNNSNLPFSGKDYGIIVVGKAASAGEITDTELWLSDKTAEVTL